MKDKTRDEIAKAMDEVGMDVLDKMSLYDIFSMGFLKGQTAILKADVEANKQILETKYVSN